MDNNLFKSIKVTRYENGVSSILEEKLINDQFLEVHLNGTFIEKILCVNDKIKELAIGNYFQCTECSPEEIMKTFVLNENVANIEKITKPSTICDYRRNCGCMINDDFTQVLKTNPIQLDYSIIPKIFEHFNNSSHLFKETAGVHGAGLYDESGNCEFFAIDLARHNCITKATGYIIRNKWYGCVNSKIIMLSSRVNAELIKMCHRAGIKVVLSRGAPSFMAYQEAVRLDITLVSFVRNGRFTVIHEGCQ